MPLDENAPCTVCIPTYNQAEYLRIAVKSVAEQTASVRLIVSNDASPDDTAGVIAELQQQYTFRAENHAVNRGISGNLQWLLRQADTPLIARLDSDDCLHPDYIRELSALLAQHPKAGYAHCAIQEIDAASQPLKLRRLARPEGYQDAESTLKRLVNGYQVAANVLLFRREALEAVNFGAVAAHVDFVEDYDLSVRIADAGWGNVYSSKTLASYRMWRGSSRPEVGRKLKEVRGLTQIFGGSFRAAFDRRGWALWPLKRRRVQLALANSDILDRASFDPGEREAITRALVELGGLPALRGAFGSGLLARVLRAFVAGSGASKQRAKQWIKRILFR